MIRRRFVNIVAQNFASDGGMYSLHRLDVSKHLFYPSTAQAQALPPAAPAEALPNTDIGGGGDVPPPVTNHLPELPAPCAGFEPPPATWLNSGWLASFFALASPRSGDGRIIGINKPGHALLYDAGSRTTRAMPTLPHPKGIDPVSVSVARAGARDEDLYVMHNLPDPGGFPCFHVLRFGDDTDDAAAGCWQRLPAPPFIRDPRYDPNFICSYSAVDDGRTICISSRADGVGTYCYDTAENTWERAGDWVLPFHGRADYIPELNLWLGFSPSRPYYLCATSDDLFSATTKDRPPKLQCVWRDLDTPSRWSPMRISLINLGAGRLCILKIFQVMCCIPEPAAYFYDCDDVEEQLAVLTGIEIFSSGGVGHQGSNNLQGLRVFKHKSIHYRFMDDVIEWVI